MIQSDENERNPSTSGSNPKRQKINTVIAVVLLLCLIVTFLVVQFTDFVDELSFSKISYRGVQSIHDNDNNNNKLQENDG